MKTSKMFRALAPVLAAAFLLLSSDVWAEPNSSISATELQEKIKYVIKKSGPAVVGLTPISAGGAGSGVIISEDGLILTAAHVVAAGGDEMKVWLSDGRQATAKKLGMHTGRDAAMMQIVGDGKWPHIDVAKANPTRGEWVIAMGHPGGFQPERTPPVRIGRVLNQLNSNSKRGFLTTDCAVSGGDSGGPLFDLEGNVVGIHSSIGMSIEQNRHVPVSAYNDDWDKMLAGEVWGGGQFAGGRPRQGAVLGVQLSPSNGDGGAVVEGVVNGSPAKKAGIESGDIIVKFAGKNIADPSQLVEAVSGKKIGDKVKVSIVRGEEKKEVEVVLGDASKLSGPVPKLQEVNDLGQFGLAPVAAKPSLGVRIADPEEGKGAEVMDVLPGSIAAKSGIKKGDVIVRFGGSEIESAEKLVAAVREFSGGKAGIKVRRGGKDVGLEAKFAAAPAPNAEEPKKEVPKRTEGVRKGFFFDGEKMREMDPEELRKMLREGKIPGMPELGGMRGAGRPQLGVEIAEGDKAIVDAVIEGSPAEKAGIKKGDEIIEFGGRDISDFDSLAAAVQAQGSGGKIKARVKRGGKVVALDVDFPKVMRFEFRMGDGKGMPTPEELRKMIPGLPDGAGEKARPAAKAQLGLMIDPSADVEKGLAVRGVADGSAAAKAGIKEGDLVLAFEGKEVGSFEDLSKAVGAKKPGDRVKVKIERDGKKRDINVTLGKAEGQASAPGAGGGDMSPEKMREMMERMRRGEITPEDLRKMFGGNLPFGQGSNVDPKFKRANSETLKGFQPAASKVKDSVVVIKSGDKRVAMGTVVKGGKVITKASQIKGRKDLRVERPDGQMTSAKEVQLLGKYDLAVLELKDKSGLKPVEFAEAAEAASVGTLVTSPDKAGNPAGFGVVSVAARSLSNENKGFLGIQIEGANEQGVVIGQAFEGGAANKAGLKPGDVIVKAGDAIVRSPVDLIRKVSGRKPGEEVVIKFLRGDKAQEATVTLRSRAELSASDQERMSHTARMGTRISQQRSGYPSALTHDMPVEPEACGTPLVNLEGEVVGVNIARAGRTKTYAIPGAVLLKLIK